MTGILSGTLSGSQATAAQLRAMATNLETVAASLTERGWAAPRANDALSWAKRHYEHRRARDAVFGCDLFGEPAWDMLLDLYIAAREDRPIAITSACIGSAVPAATAMRWLGILTGRGITERRPHAQDRRSAHVALTPDGIAMIEHYIGTCIEQEAVMDAKERLVTAGPA